MIYSLQVCNNSLTVLDVSNLLTYREVKKVKKYRNRKAMHNYFIIQEMEAGIVLQGSEIKSIRAGKVSFKDSYATIENNEVWLNSLHISPYEQSGIYNHDPERKRKLLLNKREIRKLIPKTEEQGYTLIPKEIYINEKGLAKVNLALAKGKKLYDKRETIQKKDELREHQRRLKNM
jgi:SsrA-binding protein